MNVYLVGSWDKDRGRYFIVDFATTSKKLAIQHYNDNKDDGCNWEIKIASSGNESFRHWEDMNE